jgi:hypothetical protein
LGVGYWGVGYHPITFGNWGRAYRDDLGQGDRDDNGEVCVPNGPKTTSARSEPLVPTLSGPQ